MSCFYKLIDYIGGLFSFPVPEESLTSVLVGRGFSPEDDYSTANQGERELILADLLIVLSRAQGYTNSTKSASFALTVAGERIPLEDRRAYIQEANRLYKKNGEDDSVRPFYGLNVYEHESGCKDS